VCACHSSTGVWACCWKGRSLRVDRHAAAGRLWESEGDTHSFPGVTSNLGGCRVGFCPTVSRNFLRTTGALLRMLRHVHTHCLPLQRARLDAP
jgi:hypothetical protein